MRFLSLVIIPLLFFLSACQDVVDGGSIIGTAESETKTMQIKTIVAWTLTAIATNQPSPTISPVINNEWVTHTVDLYGFDIGLPRDWTLEEVNRRREPLNGGPVLGHDCVDYRAASLDGSSVLLLQPVRGYGEGIPGDFPSDTVLINPGNASNRPGDFDENDIGRFIYEGAYSYTHCYILTFEDLSGTHQQDVCVFPPALWIEDMVPMAISFQYAGGNDQLEQAFKTADRAVLSISKH